MGYTKIKLSKAKGETQKEKLLRRKNVEVNKYVTIAVESFNYR